MAEFLIGEKAVYPGHGVAEITGVESKEIGGSAHKFYVLRLLAKDITLMVPLETARDLLVQELALAQDRSEAEVTAELEELFKRPG